MAKRYTVLFATDKHMFMGNKSKTKLIKNNLKHGWKNQRMKWLILIDRMFVLLEACRKT